MSQLPEFIRKCVDVEWGAREIREVVATYKYLHIPHIVTQTQRKRRCYPHRLFHVLSHVLNQDIEGGAITRGDVEVYLLRYLGVFVDPDTETEDCDVHDVLLSGFNYTTTTHECPQIPSPKV